VLLNLELSVICFWPSDFDSVLAAIDTLLHEGGAIELEGALVSHLFAALEAVVWR